MSLIKSRDSFIKVNISVASMRKWPNPTEPSSSKLGSIGKIKKGFREVYIITTWILYLFQGISDQTLRVMINHHLLGGWCLPLLSSGTMYHCQATTNLVFVSAPHGLNNFVKRFKMYKNFGPCLDNWAFGTTQSLKVTKTSITDRRDVMPHCVTTVRQFIRINTFMNSNHCFYSRR